ncbi:MAG: DUF4032 domain-containing protein [Acidimicrobiales bacterium]|jgi:hypothetical protein|nr:DUF4032 domain-containing protein [Acidimicrobiales bacterium]HLV90853.1 DUF4032 domain-containing protein [Acidimicrobiia bacterium]
MATSSTPPRLLIQPGVPDFLDLPWEVGVSEWDHHRLVDMPTGIHRHPVVFVAYEEGVFAIKEMPKHLAENEFAVLDRLQHRTTRSARPAALVTRPWLDPGEEQSAAVITRFVPHAFPVRNLVGGLGFGPRRNQVIDAVAGLLVEIHLAGCFWGDCSLSNLLYRFDAGAIEAVMIDAETSHIYDSLTPGQREHDLEIMIENVAGDMSDLAVAGGGDLDSADLELGADIVGRYRELWAVLEEAPIIPRGESYRIRERLQQLNDLGFDVDDVVIEPGPDGNLVEIRTVVGGRTFHIDRLAELTGIRASENQARVILGDVHWYLARKGAVTDRERRVAVVEWLTEWFEPTLERVDRECPGTDPIQGYCDLLNFRLEMAAERGADVTNDEAFEAWKAAGFPGFPLE